VIDEDRTAVTGSGSVHGAHARSGVVPEPGGGSGLPASGATIEQDRDSECDRLRFDPAIDAASLAVVAAVSGYSGREPTALSSLHAVIDTDALDDLIRPTTSGLSRRRIAFRFEGHGIAVDGSGVVEVTDAVTGCRADG
jgi:hypothetical protein